MVSSTIPSGAPISPGADASRSGLSVPGHDPVRGGRAPSYSDDPARRGRNRVEDVGDDWRSLLLGAPPAG